MLHGEIHEDIYDTIENVRRYFLAWKQITESRGVRFIGVHQRQAAMHVCTCVDYKIGSCQQCGAYELCKKYLRPRAPKTANVSDVKKFYTAVVNSDTFTL